MGTNFRDNLDPDDCADDSRHRYIVLIENLATGVFEQSWVSPKGYINKKNAQIECACWEYGNRLGWVKDTETGEIFR